jgi:sugar transferase EpsL
MRRHEVLPGITGLAQARGRNNLSWKNKFRYDVFYVDNASLLFDARILYETIGVVIFRKGFRSHGEQRKFGE